MFNKIYFEEINSTSNYLKENYKRLDHFTVVFSSYQTLGHGRRGRNWNSNRNENLLFSLLIKDNAIINKFENLSLISAVTTYKFLKHFDIDNVYIKWPNDVYVNDDKICGILLEGISSSNGIDVIVLGIGININQKSFPSDINATSMSLIKNKQYDLNELLDIYLNIFNEEINKMLNNDNSYLKIINSNNYLYGKHINVLLNGEIKRVEALNILDNNHLEVIDEKGLKQEIFSGEATIIKD